MGLLDSVTSAVNRGTESMGRSAEKIKLNNQIDQINKRRQQLAAQLGASLYEMTKDDPMFREGREQLFDEIAACDVQRAQCQQKIDELDAMAQAAAVAASSFKCVVCGATVQGDDLFCMGCGTPADQAKPAAAYPVAVANATRVCGSCGAPFADDDMFCMNCGTPADQAKPANASSDAVENATKTCASCGAPLDDNDMFCMNCGTRVSAPEDDTKSETVLTIESEQIRADE